MRAAINNQYFFQPTMPMLAIKQIKTLKELEEFKVALQQEAIQVQQNIKLLVFNNYEKFLDTANSASIIERKLLSLEFPLWNDKNNE